MQKYIFREIKFFQLKETELKLKPPNSHSYLLLPWSSLSYRQVSEGMILHNHREPLSSPLVFLAYTVLGVRLPLSPLPLTTVDFYPWSRGLILKNQIKSQPNKLCDLLRIYISFHKKLEQLQYMKYERVCYLQSYINFLLKLSIYCSIRDCHNRSNLEDINPLY